MDGRTAAQRWYDMKFYIIPLEAKEAYRRGSLQASFLPGDVRRGDDVGLRCGLQRDPTYLTVIDYDGANAADNCAPLVRLLRARGMNVVVCRSTGGLGRHVYIRTRTPIRTCWLRDASGQKIGDIKGVGGYVVAPTPDRVLVGDLAAIPLLDADDRDMVLSLIGYQDAPERAQSDDTPEDDPAPIRAAGARWQGRMHLIRGADGIPYGIKRGTKTDRILRGELQIVKTNTTILDPSIARYDTVMGMAMCGYDDERIAAFQCEIWNYERLGGQSDKTADQVYTDIARCIRLAREKFPHIFPRRYAADVPHVQAVAADAAPAPAPAPDRARGVTSADAYLSCLTEHRDGPIVFLNVADSAAAAGISRRRAERYEQALTATGRIKRVVSPDRRTSRLELLDVGGTKNRTTADLEADHPVLEADHPVAETPRGGTVRRTRKPQTAISHAHVREKGTGCPTGPDRRPADASAAAPVAQAVADAPPVVAVAPERVPSQNPAAPSLRSIVADLVPSEGGRRAVDLVPFVRVVDPTAPWSDAAIIWHIRNERQRIQHERSAAREAARIAGMGMNDLRRAIRSDERSIAESHRRGTKKHRFFVWRLALLTAERERRCTAIRAAVAPPPVDQLRIDPLLDMPATSAQAVADVPPADVSPMRYAAAWLGRQKERSVPGGSRGD